MVNLKEILLSLPQQNVFIKQLKECDEVAILSWNVSIHFSQLFPMEKYLSGKLLSSCVVLWNYGSPLQRHAEFRTVFLEMCFCQPVQYCHCATIPQGRAFIELGTSLQKTKIAPSQAACSLGAVILSTQKTKRSTETAQGKAGSLQQSKDMNLGLLSGQCLDQKAILPPLICFQVMWLGVSLALQFWTELPSFLTVSLSETLISLEFILVYFS